MPRAGTKPLPDADDGERQISLPFRKKEGRTPDLNQR